MVTTVPPSKGPRTGKRERTEGFVVMSKLSVLTVTSRPFIVRRSATVAGGCLGLRQRISVEEYHLAETVAPPNQHLRSPVFLKFLPRTTTLVPPELGASVGNTESSNAS
jgi:hypothetical protein